MRNGRDPEKVGVLWGVGLIVGETESEAKARREQLLTMIPSQAVGPYLSHNAGYDFSTLAGKILTRGAERENNAPRTLRRSASCSSSRNMVGEKGEITRKDFFEFGLRTATNYDRTYAGTAAQLADMLEEEFEAGGSRGGFMVVASAGGAARAA